MSKGKRAGPRHTVAACIPQQFLPLMDKRLEQGGYLNYSDYIRELIRKDIEQAR